MSFFQERFGLILPAAVGIVLILVGSVVYGLWTDRWFDTTPEQLQAFVQQYEKIPETVEDPESTDDWKATVAETSDERIMAAAGAKAHYSATYRKPRSGEKVSVYMICGASRDVSVHTPDACYPGAGFLMEGESQQYTLREGDFTAEFTTAVFRKEEAAGVQRLRLFWSWNADGNWEAPNWPRFKYGARRPLNKLYLITEEPAPQNASDSPCLEFAKRFLPKLQKELFGGEPAPEPAATERAPTAEPSSAPPADAPAAGGADQGEAGGSGAES